MNGSVYSINATNHITNALSYIATALSRNRVVDADIASVSSRSSSVHAKLLVGAAIKQLPEGNIRQLSAWLQEDLDQMWDQ